MMSRVPLASRLGGGAAVGSGSSVNGRLRGGAGSAAGAAAGAGSSSLKARRLRGGGGSGSGSAAKLL